MTTLVTFKGYGVNATAQTIVVERITNWFQIDYNGRYGTCIVLDTGNEITVEEWPADVKMKVEAALAANKILGKN